jgi:hypothetical protein
VNRRTRRGLAIGIVLLALLALVAHFGGSRVMAALAAHLHGAR